MLNTVEAAIILHILLKLNVNQQKNKTKTFYTVQLWFKYIPWAYYATSSTFA